MTERTRSPGRKARFDQESVTTGYGIATDLAFNHPAVIQGRTLFPSTVVAAEDAPRLLVSGKNNAKIGGEVEKGERRGWPIYTLTLEERATCPRSCHHWRTCYGNNMQWARRHQAGPQFEARLAQELAALQAEHFAGFVVRLHVLGDFYSLGYVAAWEGWLDRFPSLHVFGYTAWPPATPIGAALRALARRRWDRFAVRLSAPVPVNGEREAVTWWGEWPPPADTGPELDGAILCPGQRHATETCGTCGLCWATQANIAFAVHGRRHGGGRKPKERPEAERAADPAPAVEVKAALPVADDIAMGRIGQVSDVLRAAAGPLTRRQIEAALPALHHSSITSSLTSLRSAGLVKLSRSSTKLGAAGLWSWAEPMLAEVQQQAEAPPAPEPDVTPSETQAASAPVPPPDPPPADPAPVPPDFQAQVEAAPAAPAAEPAPAPPAPPAVLVGAPLLVDVARLLRRTHPQPLSMKQVMRGASIEKSNASRALDRLYAAGLIDRLGTRMERRYRLTPAGLAALKHPEIAGRDPAAPVPAAEDPDEQVKQFLADRGVTKCPPAYAAPVTGADDKPGRLPVLEEPSWRDKANRRAGAEAKAHERKAGGEDR